MPELRYDQLPLGAGHAPEVPLQAAASIIVMRREPFEVLFLRRNEASTFVPGAWVFPGGTVDAVDLACAEKSGDESELNVARICGIRELFEETGVWLGDPLDDPDEARASLLTDPSRFIDLFDRARPAIDELVLHARWVTPVGVPKRFDTFFFVAETDADTEGTPENMEGTEVVWLRPTEALEKHAAGDFPIIFPTIRNLQAIEPFTNAQDLMENRRNATIAITRPVLITTDGKKRIVIPGES